jgi:hypothetical protein
VSALLHQSRGIRTPINNTTVLTPSSRLFPHSGDCPLKVEGWYPCLSTSRRKAGFEPEYTMHGWGLPTFPPCLDLWWIDGLGFVVLVLYIQLPSTSGRRRARYLYYRVKPCLPGLLYLPFALPSYFRRSFTGFPVRGFTADSWLLVRVATGGEEMRPVSEALRLHGSCPACFQACSCIAAFTVYYTTGHRHAMDTCR